MDRTFTANVASILDAGLDTGREDRVDDPQPDVEDGREEGLEDDPQPDDEWEGLEDLLGLEDDLDLDVGAATVMSDRLSNTNNGAMRFMRVFFVWVYGAIQ